jgi:ankyrin repeat protein
LQNVVQLLDSDVQVNIIDKNNKDNTPLHYAVQKGKRKKIIIKLLLDRLADITIKNSNN